MRNKNTFTKMITFLVKNSILYEKDSQLNINTSLKTSTEPLLSEFFTLETNYDVIMYGKNRMVYE